MSLTLATLRTEALQTLGDLGLVDVLPANVDLAVNWAIIQAARFCRKTTVVRTYTVAIGASAIPVSPALEVVDVVLLP